MLNRDINSRFEDWLLSPSETMDFEVKRWIDLTDSESQGLVAKALIALENHGGGFLLFGYTENESKQLVPDSNRPASLETYLTDSINAIVKRRAEPVFNVEVTLQRHPVTGEEYPLVRVPGRSKIPVRSDSATEGGALKNNVYYIRAPGPESRGPVTGAEWDAVLRRAVANQREEIIGLLRRILPAAGDFGLTRAPSESDCLSEFVRASAARWKTLNETLPTNHPARITLGHFQFAARLIGKPTNSNANAILDAVRSARRYTGWPIFVLISHEKTRPKLIDGCLEAWLAEANYPDVGHADFWRIDPSGNFFSLRGYQEDSLDPERRLGDAGTRFEVTLPIWRLGEFLLRVAEIGAAMFDDDFEVAVSCEWHGLKDRALFSHNGRRFLRGTYRTSQSIFVSTGQFPVAAIKDLLPDVVKTLTLSLYEHFDFFVPPDSMYSEELAKMMQTRFVA